MSRTSGPRPPRWRLPGRGAGRARAPVRGRAGRPARRSRPPPGRGGRRSPTPASEPVGSGGPARPPRPVRGRAAGGGRAGRPPAVRRAAAVSAREPASASAGGAAWRHPWAGEARDFLRQLTPAWWLLRGYLVVAPLAWQDANGTTTSPCPPSATAGRWAASPSSGPSPRRSPSAGGPCDPPGDGLVLAFDILLVLFALGAVCKADAQFDQVEYFSAAGPSRVSPYLLSAVRAGHQHLPVLGRRPAPRGRAPVRPGRPPAAGRVPAVVARRVRPHPRLPEGGRRGPGRVHLPPALRLLPGQYQTGPGQIPGPCVATPARPPVPLPTFPAAG